VILPGRKETVMLHETTSLTTGHDLVGWWGQQTFKEKKDHRQFSVV